MLKNFLFVALGGALGAVMRYGAGLLAAAMGASGHLGTFIINALGSFVLGLLTSACQSGGWMLFAAIGVCGAFTTFSTYSVQAVTLLQQGKIGAASLYIFGTVAVCLLFAWMGYILGSKLA